MSERSDAEDSVLSMTPEDHKWMIAASICATVLLALAGTYPLVTRGGVDGYYLSVSGLWAAATVGQYLIYRRKLELDQGEAFVHSEV